MFVIDILKSAKAETQLEKGTKDELEHVPTFDKIRKYLKDNNEFPSNETIAEWTASDHLSKIQDYYDRLEVMENEATRSQPK